MAIIAYPFDLQDISEAQFGALQGSAFATGIAASPTTDHYKVTANGSNLTLTITAVGGNSQANVRGHAVSLTSNAVLTVAAAEAGARVDLVVLRLDYAANTIAPAIIKGTSGSSTVPSPSWGAGNFYDLPLAKVAVGAGVLLITSTNLTDYRRFAGFTPGAWPTVGRPTTHLSMGWNTSDLRWEYTLDGITWKSLTETDLASNGVTGILPIAKGGTGATSATAALQALGIFVQTAQPAYAAGRVWIKIP
jgi:hypothetical protein